MKSLLPTTLSRKAAAQTFDRLTPVAWEKLFEREDQNGIAKLRAEGDFPGRAYYSTEGLILWLIRNSHYSFEETRSRFYEIPPRPTVRTHILAG